MQPAWEMPPLFPSSKTQGVGAEGSGRTVGVVWAEEINVFLIFFLQALLL